MTLTCVACRRRDSSSILTRDTRGLRRSAAVSTTTRAICFQPITKRQTGYGFPLARVNVEDLCQRSIRTNKSVAQAETRRAGLLGPACPWEEAGYQIQVDNLAGDSVSRRVCPAPNRQHHLISRAWLPYLTPTLLPLAPRTPGFSCFFSSVSLFPSVCRPIVGGTHFCLPLRHPVLCSRSRRMVRKARLKTTMNMLLNDSASEAGDKAAPKGLPYASILKGYSDYPSWSCLLHYYSFLVVFTIICFFITSRSRVCQNG
jgi:hypothetical protein